MCGHAFDDPFDRVQVFQELVYGQVRQFPGYRVRMFQRFRSQYRN